MFAIREKRPRLTRPVFVFLVALLVLNLAAPLLTVQAGTNVMCTPGEGVGGDGKPEEWTSPKVRYALEEDAAFVLLASQLRLSVLRLATDLFAWWL